MNFPPNNVKDSPSISVRPFLICVIIITVILTSPPLTFASSGDTDSNLAPLNESDMRSVTAQQGLDLKFNLELGGGFGSELLIRDPESGGALNLEGFDLKLKYSSFWGGLELNLDGGGATDRPFLQLGLPANTDIEGHIISDDVFIDNLNGSSTGDIGGLAITDRNGNDASIGASGKIKLFESTAD